VPVYDRIGRGYASHRCADLRIVESIIERAGIPADANVADIGAGTGNYSRALADRGWRIAAVEPSGVMRRQADAHPGVEWIAAAAEALPIADGSVQAAICILAAHHFTSLPDAIREMGRIVGAGSVLWLTFDPRAGTSPWLADYFPDIWAEAHRVFPVLHSVCNLFWTYAGRRVEIETWLVPQDLRDCFLAAGWRNPAIYLEASMRAGMSAFALADQERVNRGLRRLERDVSDGSWQRRYGHLLEQDAIDWEYRFLRA